MSSSSPSWPGLPQLPPETYHYLLHALLSLQRAAPPPHPLAAPTDATSNYDYPWLSAAQAEIPLPAPQAAASPSTLEDQDETVSVTEDKRRRNTAASARFRVKKKLKTLNLERLVADLERRTEDLEREAADLRRENAWLKEIVLLKGKNLAALNLAASDHQPREDQDSNHVRTGSQSGLVAQRRDKGKGKGKGKDKER